MLEQFPKDRRTKDGYAATCKTCNNQRNAQYYQTHKGQILQKTVKYRKDHPKVTRKSNINYYKNHHEQEKMRCMKWRKENLGKHAANHAQWAKSNREKLRKYDRKFAKTHPEYIRKKFREYRQANPDIINDIAARRRARLAHAPMVEKIDRQSIYVRDGGKCHICHKRVAGKGFHLDHLIPLSKGGPHIASNLKVAHPSCNSRMGAGRLPAQLLLLG